MADERAADQTEQVADQTEQACCEQGQPQLSEMTHDFLKALASPTRQQIMLLFARGAELSVGEVAERAGIGQSTASQQLTLLRRGGIVTARRDGKIVLYRADKTRAGQALADLQAYLRFCC
ncbi:metalloregulator ArsR/SmtB family transcription factor [Actinocatenispora sera]|uniref:ArsR/SmtB family transcription factor n=1 Tax=Actinocatenispora sera TaxID=390989 RepID=UPI0033FE9A30